MATCPNCGEIVMTGDPYCTHCGATLRWYFDDEEEEDYPPEDTKPDHLIDIFNEMVKSDLSSDEKLDLFKDLLFLTDYLLEEIRQEMYDEEKRYKCRFIMAYTADYPQTYIFLREDKYRDVLIFNRCYIEYTPGRFNPEEREFHYDYKKLFENPKFIKQAEKLQEEGLTFKRVRSDISYPRWENDIDVIFSDGDEEVSYRIDDDLNFIKPL